MGKKFNDLRAEQLENNYYQEIYYANLNDLYNELLQGGFVEEGIGKISGMVTLIIGGLIVKIGSIRQQVKQETDIDKKLNLIADLVRLSAMPGLLASGISSGNQKDINKLKSFKGK